MTMKVFILTTTFGNYDERQAAKVGHRIWKYLVKNGMRNDVHIEWEGREVSIFVADYIENKREYAKQIMMNCLKENEPL